MAGRIPWRSCLLRNLDLRRLDQLVEVDDVSWTATLQAGLTGPAAEELLAARGFTLGHVPQSFERATIGGYAATRSAGQLSTGWGRFDALVERVRVATPSGDLDLGRAPGSAAGPDLRQLVLGSEGAFGVITELTLRVRPRPCSWPSAAARTRATTRIPPVPATPATTPWPIPTPPCGWSPST